MKAWVFVEGESDRLGLEALWRVWREDLRAKGHGIRIIALDGKAKFLRKFGARAAEKLAANGIDVVVGFPDLYPTSPFANSDYQHSTVNELRDLQTRLVRSALQTTQAVKENQIKTLLKRLHASALKHDFEMLLLAAKEELRQVLGTKETLGKWREPVEEQNLERPPKRIVEELFRTKSAKRRSYQDTLHARTVLARVTHLETILKCSSGPTCPVFVEALRWLCDKFGVPCGDLPETGGHEGPTARSRK